MFFFIFDDEQEIRKVDIDEESLTPEEFDFFSDGVRKVFSYDDDEWYFSVVDVCKVLTDSTNPKSYWYVLKSRLETEGNQTFTNCKRLKMPAKDGRMRLTDVANTEELLRIIQSIPSKRAEPFKQWLARVGSERLEEMADPEKAINRGIDYYKQKGYSDEWIKQRMEGKSVRDELTDEWKRVGVEEPKDYAILTNLLTQAWSGKTVKQYKQFKGIHKENLRDNMTNLELTLNQLAEVSTTAISKAKNPETFAQSKSVAQEGGNIAKNARLELEQALGKSVISPLNASSPLSLDKSDDE